MNVDHGLNAKTVDAVRAVLARHPQVAQAILFGSRAKGNYRPGSDIDLALKGTGLSLTVLNRIYSDLDDLPIPYEFSLVVFDNINEAGLLAHIERVGLVFYQRADDSVGSAKIGL